MSRLARIVCDNSDCKAQVERYASDWFQEYRGMDDTPPGWYRLTYHEPKQIDASDPAVSQAPQEPRFFCSVECVRHFTGELKQPESREKR